LKNVIEASADKVTILATGPLTNIAELNAKYPHLKKRIEKIVMMGGAVKVPGNVSGLLPQAKNSVSEWNFFADPKAAEQVIHSGIPVTLVSLDSTRQVPLTKEFFERTGIEDQPDLKLAHQILQVYLDEIGDKAFQNNIYAWDQLAAMVMLDPSSVKTEMMSLVVNSSNGDIKPAAKGQKGAKIQVVTEVYHPETFLRSYIAMVKSNHLFVQKKQNQDAFQYRAKKSEGTKS
jgi:inosine-uridine nucleoside N-ribohydrolase